MTNSWKEKLKEKEMSEHLRHVNFKITKYDWNRLQDLLDSGIIMNKSEFIRTAISNYLDVRYNEIPYITKPIITKDKT